MVDLRSVVRSVIGDLELLIENKRAGIDIEDLSNVRIEADVSQMRQLFQNLISNALKFQESHEPKIRIYSRMVRELPAEGGELEDFCRIYVEDNGIGFDEKYLDLIFAPFKRLHVRTSRYEGTGMGLAICRKIVESHGGSITARSTPGEGSTFIVTLPLKQDSGNL
jgi:signal transduction histidine kinase